MMLGFYLVKVLPSKMVRFTWWYKFADIQWLKIWSWTSSFEVYEFINIWIIIFGEKLLKWALVFFLASLLDFHDELMIWVCDWIHLGIAMAILTICFHIKNQAPFMLEGKNGPLLCSFLHFKLSELFMIRINFFLLR